MIYEKYKKMNCISSNMRNAVYSGKEISTKNIVIIKNYMVTSSYHREKAMLNIVNKLDDHSEYVQMIESSDEENIIIFEFISTIDLYEAITKELFTLEEKIKIMIHISKAIEKLHNIDIIYRDIKAENIMVDPKTLKIKIIDFDSSGLISDSEFCTTYNYGTYDYLDPMSNRATFATDVYALGVLFYEIMSDKIYRRNHDRNIISQLETIENKNIQNLISKMLFLKKKLRPKIGRASCRERV